MARVAAYERSPWSRPPFAADGVVVARRPITLSRPYEVGEVIPAGELDARQLIIHQRNWLVDTLPKGTPVIGAEPPKAPEKPKQAAPPQRGR